MIIRSLEEKRKLCVDGVGNQWSGVCTPEEGPCDGEQVTVQEEREREEFDEMKRDLSMKRKEHHSRKRIRMTLGFL